MTQKEEKGLLWFSLIFLIVSLGVVVSLLILQKQDRISDASKADYETAPMVMGEDANKMAVKSEMFFMKDGAFFEGTAADANASHADCFVQVSNAATERIRIYYDNSYAIPDFDSKQLAEALKEALAIYYETDMIDVQAGSTSELADAMEPAIYIEGIGPIEDLDKKLKDCIKTIFEETDDK